MSLQRPVAQKGSEKLLSIERRQNEAKATLKKTPPGKNKDSFFVKLKNCVRAKAKSFCPALFLDLLSLFVDRDR